jgi:hypothetical protein
VKEADSNGKHAALRGHLLSRDDALEIVNSEAKRPLNELAPRATRKFIGMIGMTYVISTATASFQDPSEL